MECIQWEVHFTIQKIIGGKKVLMQFYDMQYYAEVSGYLIFLYILGYIKEARLSCNLCGILLF